MEVSSCRHDWLNYWPVSSPGSLPWGHCRGRGTVGLFGPGIMPSTIRFLTLLSCLGLSNTKRHHFRHSKGLRSSCVRNQGPRPNIIIESVPINQEITRVLGSLPRTRNWGRRPDKHFLLYHNITSWGREKREETFIFIFWLEYFYKEKFLCQMFGFQSKLYLWWPIRIWGFICFEVPLWICEFNSLWWLSVHCSYCSYPSLTLVSRSLFRVGVEPFWWDPWRNFWYSSKWLIWICILNGNLLQLENDGLLRAVLH